MAKEGIWKQCTAKKEPDENADVLCGIYDDLKEKLSPELLELHQNSSTRLKGEGFNLELLIGIECMEK